MADATDKTPKLTELSVGFSVTIRANLGNYEHGDVHLSRTEKWDVAGFTLDEVNALYQERFILMRKELGDQAEYEYKDMLGIQDEESEKDAE